MVFQPPSWQVGFRRNLVVACVASMLLTAGPSAVVAQNQLPALGDAVSEDFGVGTERKLGDQIMREIRRDPDYIDDPMLQDYLLELWQPLVAVARQRGEIGVDISERYAWEPFLVRDRSVNAFALPGGFVGVHLGLIAMTSSRDELASVLAHEMSHVTQRHIARSITNNKRQSLLSAAAMILGVLAAARSSSADAANAVIAGGQAASIQGQLNFSRDMEREADRIGFGLLTGAGFSPSGMAAMFEKLDQASRLNDSGAFPYLRSHPLTTERIGEARSRLGSAPRAAPSGLLEHTLAQARARVLMDTRVQALRRWQTLDQDPPSRPLTGTSVAEPLAAACSSALASTLLRDWARADASLQQAAVLLRVGLSGRGDGARNANADVQAQRALAMLVAQSQLERGNAAAAAAALAASPGQPIDASRSGMLLSAQIALAAAGPFDASSGRPAGLNAGDEAALRRQAESLQTWVALQAHDATVWHALSQVWGRLGQPLRSVRAEAEGRYVIGDLTGAVDRLRAGQRLARSGGGGGSGSNDFIESSVIDARLREIEGERRREMAERDEKRGG